METNGSPIDCMLPEPIGVSLSRGDHGEIARIAGITGRTPGEVLRDLVHDALLGRGQLSEPIDLRLYQDNQDEVMRISAETSFTPDEILRELLGMAVRMLRDSPDLVETRGRAIEEVMRDLIDAALKARRQSSLPA